MQRLERNPDPVAVLREGFRDMRSRLWTALPAIVDSFNAQRMTVAAKPASSSGATSAPLTSRRTSAVPMTAVEITGTPSANASSRTRPWVSVREANTNAVPLR